MHVFIIVFIVLKIKIMVTTLKVHKIINLR